MKLSRIDQQNAVQEQSEDLVGVIAGVAEPATGGRPQRDVAPQSSFEVAWGLTH